VPALRYSPVENVFQFEGHCEERTFLEVQNLHLKRKYAEQET